MKASETPDSVVALTDSRPAQRLVAVWINVPILKVEPEPEGRSWPTWRQLWNGHEVDLDTAAALATIPRPLIGQHVKQAQICGWVYPDGTINQYAQQIVRSVSTKILRDLTGHPKKRDASNS